VFNLSIKLLSIINTSCKFLLSSNCLHCLKISTDLSKSTNLFWYSSRLDSSVTLFCLSSDNFGFCSRYCLFLNKYIELLLQLILNCSNRRYNTYIYNSWNSVDKSDTRRDYLFLTRLIFKTDILINYFSNASFVLIADIVYIYNKQTDRSTSISKTNLRAIRKNYLKYLFLANRYIDNSIFKNSQRWKLLTDLNRIRRDNLANRQ